MGDERKTIGPKTIVSSPWVARLALAFLSAAAHLPIARMQACGRLLGSLCARLPNRQWAIANLNLEMCFPDLPAAARRLLVIRSLEETGKAALELPALWRWSVERLAELEGGVEGEELLNRELAAGRGTVLLAPHLGNWEFLNHFLMQRFQLVCLYRPPRIAELESFVRGSRERTGCVMVPATTAGLRPLLKTLRAGRPVLILPDQEPLRSHGVHAPFFGVPALTMTLVTRMLRSTGAGALFVFAERRPSGKFRVRFREAPPGLTDADEVRAAAALNRGVEACVELCPEQYLWSYKRFLSAPPGEPTPYRAIWSKRRLRKHPWPPARATLPAAPPPASVAGRRPES